MQREAEMLRIANSVEVGPRILRTSENFLLMELFKGELIEEWIGHLDSNRDQDLVKGILLDVLQQCYRLDSIGLDHGELSQARRHVLIDERRPRILDFETASTTRKPRNLSCLCQYMFVSGSVAQKIWRILGKTNLDQLRVALADYKQKKNLESYREALHACLLAS